MWLGIKNVIGANHMISLIKSSTADTSFVHVKSDGIDQSNAIYFDKVKNN